MNEFTFVLGAPEEYVNGLRSGLYTINRAANRVVEAQSGRFVSALVPPSTLNGPQLGAALQHIGIAANVAAVASVATVGICVVGFAVVLSRLRAIEGKLDALLGEVESLKRAVGELKTEASAFHASRMHAAAEALERALAAETEASRRDLASFARSRFLESKLLYAELFRHAAAWERLDVPVVTAQEMSARIVACAIGEMQAEFVLGDMGAFRHASEQAAALFESVCAVDPRKALVMRSDAATAGIEEFEHFSVNAEQTATELAHCRRSVDWTSLRLRAFADDAELPRQLNARPHEILRAARILKGDGIVFVPLAA